MEPAGMDLNELNGDHCGIIKQDLWYRWILLDAIVRVQAYREYYLFSSWNNGIGLFVSNDALSVITSLQWRAG